MSPANTQSLVDEHTALPVARIDAQEQSFVTPLREYLETNGCQVYVNEHPFQFVTYHIVAGDRDYVKHFFSGPKVSNTKRLGVVISSSLSDAENLADTQTKIIVVDPLGLTPEDVVEIFSFFFAGIEMIRDKRRNRHDQKPMPVSDVDQTRISHIISDVFHEKKPSTHRPRKIKTKLWAIVAFLFVVIFFPVVWYGGSVMVSGTCFAVSGFHLKDGDLSGSVRTANIGRYWLYQSNSAFTIVRIPLKIIGFSDFVRGQERLLSFLYDSSKSFEETQRIVLLGKKVGSLLLASQKEDGVTPAPAIEELRMTVAAGQSSLGLAEAELATLIRDKPFPFFLAPIRRFAERSQHALSSVRGILTYIDQILTLYPRVAGFREPKTYLVLLQNSNEIRPTGGFIGSIGVATFEEGFLSDFSIQDVYALDGQLKGHVDPPLPIQELLGQEHWYLRDSNWDPDFKASAQKAIWFYEKESGKRVDGVVAVNEPVVVDLLMATGPIFLSDYNDRITAENFFGKSIFYTQEQTFPGSTQKSDFLGSLARSLMTTLTTKTNVNPMALFRAFSSGLTRRDIAFMFTREDLQQLVEHFGWSGRVFNDSGCKGVTEQTCLFDPAAFVEANVSVSKVNYFVKHSALREIVITPDGVVNEQLSMNIRNTVNLAADPNARGVGGTYRSYARFLLPEDSSIKEVTIDGVVVRSRDTTSKKQPEVPYIEKSEGPPGSQSLGVAFDVPPGSERQIRISYKRLNPLPFGRGGAVLDLLWYKHPGISDVQMKTTVRYPVFWVANDESGGAGLVAKDGELQYNTTILQDQLTRIKFIK